jgi:hypothetical protein
VLGLDIGRKDVVMLLNVVDGIGVGLVHLLVRVIVVLLLGVDVIVIAQYASSSQN